jgi:hypothetical protein
VRGPARGSRLWCALGLGGRRQRDERVERTRIEECLDVFIVWAIAQSVYALGDLGIKL